MLPTANTDEIYMDRLEDLLNRPTPDMTTGEVSKLFQEIAEALMGNYIIAKGDNRYAIVEIEFYLYTDEHPDYITYPRIIEAGRWFFHQSGVDLTFRSEGVESYKGKDKRTYYRLEKDKKHVFGGILIRGLYKFPYVDGAGGKIEAEYVFGPQKVVDELWHDFNAFKNVSKEYPVLEQASKVEKEKLSNRPVPYKRHIKIDKDEQSRKICDWAKRLGIDLPSDNSINDDCDKTDKVDIFEEKYRYFNIIEGDDTWDAIKCLTMAEKKELKSQVTK